MPFDIFGGKQLCCKLHRAQLMAKFHIASWPY